MHFLDLLKHYNAEEFVQYNKFHITLFFHDTSSQLSKPFKFFGLTFSTTDF